MSLRNATFLHVMRSFNQFGEYNSNLLFLDVVTRSAAPLLLAVLTQAVGALCCVLGHCVKGRRLCTFIAGVLFIVSGKSFSLLNLLVPPII